ncbi:class I SAM-dependent methyltransferase [Pseudaminobacter sp. NGMCC 1.201702]|uniref:class I SAM-dependent methyltransferase n=1 Tax=Pseudaminobacter sp. NGMCC 1.201702 TaxID=3391825 RepID=UPI0039F14350
MADSIRYDFGEQWDEYARRATDEDLITAQNALAELIPVGFSPQGKSFLDIGCGSGMHSVAAARHGFLAVTAVDYYDGSVRATKWMAARSGTQVTAFRDDILNTKITGHFDVVYSWGVLHHTGNMLAAINNAKALVAPGGLFIISIYLKTPLCEFWKVEKRIYAMLPRFMQAGIDYAFRGLSIALKAVDKKQEKERGMDWQVGVRDWLGGYPYESATPEEVAKMVGNGFALDASYHTESGPGILGTRCAEYVFRRLTVQPA